MQGIVEGAQLLMAGNAPDSGGSSQSRKTWMARWQEHETLEYPPSDIKDQAFGRL